MPRTSLIADTDISRQSHPTARLSAVKRAILHFLEPGVLPVLAMALIVGGWSYGLKLSHYLNTGVTKASTTRMWVDHRNDSAAPVAHHQVEQKFLTPQLSALAAMPALHFSWQQLLASESAPAHVTEFVSPLHPLRAPPTNSLLA